MISERDRAFTNFSKILFIYNDFNLDGIVHSFSMFVPSMSTYHREPEIKDFISTEGLIFLLLGKAKLSRHSNYVHFNIR